jgi:hypothetical protein
MSSAFKTLFTDMVNNGGDYSKLSKDMTKQMLKVFVKETSPYFLISDSYFYVPAYFTKAALDEFEKKYPSIKVGDLNEKVILISNWSLEIKKVDSSAVFTSYNGLEVRLIVHSFKAQMGESVHPNRWPSNLYRDDEFKQCIQAFRHRCVQAACDKVGSNDTPLTSKNIADNIVAGKDDWSSVKEGNTPVVSLGGGKKAAAASGAAKVKGGAKGKAKAAAKASAKKGGARVADKVMNFKAGAVKKGKQSTSKKAASPGGKKSAVGTTDQMTMQTLKKFIKYQKESGKSGKTVLGKKSAGKKSAGK